MGREALSPGTVQRRPAAGGSDAVASRPHLSRSLKERQAALGCRSVRFYGVVDLPSHAAATRSTAPRSFEKGDRQWID